MNIKSFIDKIAAHSNKGELQDVEDLCHQVLEKDRQNFHALNYLGLALHRQGRHKEAVVFFKKALKRNKAHAFVYNNLGCTYLETQDFSEASACFERALHIHPDVPEYSANFGLALYQLRMYKEAREQFEQAIHLDPEFATAMVYLGVCLQHMGMLKESIAQHLAANDLDPHLTLVYVHLFNALSFSHITDDALHVAQAGLQLPNLSSIERFELLNGIAKIGWLTGQIDVAKEAISRSNAIPLDLVNKNKNFRNLLAYHRYLSRLLTLREEFQQLYAGEVQQAMFFVGDSHCLSPSDTIVHYGTIPYRVLSTLIYGCKAYHLSRPGNNQFKASLESILKALPQRSCVVVGVGEIDCRHDEGILVAHMEKGMDFRTSVPEFIDDYVEFVAKTATQYQHHLIFYGVPASNPDILQALPTEKGILLQEIITLFNNEMVKATRKRNLEFLDVYGLTLKSQSTPGAGLYIDGFHLHPKTLGLLFPDYLLSP